MAKAKWLAEATTRELVVLIEECIKEEDLKKAKKVVGELLERIPETDGHVTIEEAIAKLHQDLDGVLSLYNQEADSVVEEEPEEVEEVEEKPAKKKKSKKKSKKAKEEEIDEDEEEPVEEDGYEDMSQGALKKELRRRGIKVSKSMKKADMIRALEADDEE
jgi:hypothetical protein